MPQTLKALLASIERAMPLWLFWGLAAATMLSCLVALLLVGRQLLARRRRHAPARHARADAIAAQPGAGLRCYRLTAMPVLAGTGIEQLLVAPSGLFAIVELGVSGRLSGKARGEHWRLSQRGRHTQSLPNPLLACRTALAVLAAGLGVAPEKFHPAVLVAGTARWASSGDRPIGVYFSATELVEDVNSRLNVVFTEPERLALIERLDTLLLAPVPSATPAVALLPAPQAAPARRRLFARWRRATPAAANG